LEGAELQAWLGANLPNAKDWACLYVSEKTGAALWKKNLALLDPGYARIMLVDAEPFPKNRLQIKAKRILLAELKDFQLGKDTNPYFQIERKAGVKQTWKVEGGSPAEVKVILSSWLENNRKHINDVTYVPGSFVVSDEDSLFGSASESHESSASASSTSDSNEPKKPDRAPPASPPSSAKDIEMGDIGKSKEADRMFVPERQAAPEGPSCWKDDDNKYFISAFVHVVVWIIMFCFFIAFTINEKGYIGTGIVALILAVLLLIMALAFGFILGGEDGIKHALFFGIPDAICLITLIALVAAAGSVAASGESLSFLTINYFNVLNSGGSN